VLSLLERSGQLLTNAFLKKGTSVSKHVNELDIPPQALTDVRAVEIARIWAAGGNQVVAFRPETWTDPGTWGVMLVDFAKHIADASEQLGKGTKGEILRAIRLAFDTEWRSPTDHQSGNVQE
jgi:hypothetical protein